MSKILLAAVCLLYAATVLIMGFAPKTEAIASEEAAFKLSGATRIISVSAVRDDFIEQAVTARRAVLAEEYEARYIENGLGAHIARLNAANQAAELCADMPSKALAVNALGAKAVFGEEEDDIRVTGLAWLSVGGGETEVPPSIGGVVYGFGTLRDPEFFMNPDDEKPDISLYEVTRKNAWHIEGAELYLMNASVIAANGDEITIPMYELGTALNKGGTYEDRAKFVVETKDGVAKIDVFLPEEVISAKGLYLKDVTAALNADENEYSRYGTYKPYDDGFDLDAVEVWIR